MQAQDGPVREGRALWLAFLYRDAGGARQTDTMDIYLNRNNTVREGCSQCS